MPNGVQNFPVALESNASVGVPAETPLGVYVHLPFCKAKCSYCAFVSRAPRSEEEIDRYLAALLKHIRLGGSCAGERSVSTVFFGGGTPSLLGATRLARILEAIRETFSLSPDAEITLEANPESATPELFARLQPLGVNRVSLGAQSFFDEELQLLGRVHTADGIARAVAAAREAGIGNLSLDLIFALPEQIPERWEQTLRQALSCAPDHISAYGLTYEEGTPLERKRLQGQVNPALEETYVEMYHILGWILAAAGFRQYEISNWGLPGKECRHNLIYWDRDEYLAYGVSAHGLWGRIRYGFTSDMNAYVRTLERLSPGEFQTIALPELCAETTVLTPEIAASDAMIFGLRKTDGISLERFARRYGFHPEDRWPAPIARFQQRGLLEQKDGTLRLTPQAYLISNEVLQYFLD